MLSLLGLGCDEPFVWAGDGRFDLRVAESPWQMEAFLAEKQAAGETARIAAGFCWPWSDPRPDGTLVPDVVVATGNVRGTSRANEVSAVLPGSAFWATDPAGFGQVGCVYTAQGFEYEWSGVIIGPDLVARDGRTRHRRSHRRIRPSRARRRSATRKRTA